MDFIDSGFFPAIFISILLISISSGYLFARKRYVLKQRAWKVSGIENGIIGFYRLLLSFKMLQFGTAYRERIALIHQHADALQRAYHESYFLSDSLHRKIKHGFIAIAEMKIKLSKANLREANALIEQINEVYRRGWKQIRQGRQRNGPTAEGHLIADELHEAATLEQRIQHSYVERTPVMIMILLVLGAWMVGFFVGFTNGFNERHHFLVPLIFFMLTGLTVLAIRDLDSPQHGIIKPSYVSYERALLEMNKE
jgi:hypothetical protein